MDSDQEQDYFELLEGLLIRRLQDDDFYVVSAAVECRIERISDSEAIFTPLLDVMHRCMKQLKKTGNPELLSIALRLVDLLSSQSLCQDPQRSDKICSQFLDYLFPYCSVLLPVSVKIGAWFKSLQHPVASLVTSNVDFLSFKSGKKTEADLNKYCILYFFAFDCGNRLLIENMFCKEQQDEFEEVVCSLLEDCGTRVTCFTFLSLQHLFNNSKNSHLLDLIISSLQAEQHKQDSASLLVCLLKTIESHVDHDEVLDEEVQLSVDVSVSLLGTYLATLETVLESTDRSTIDRRTAECALIQILRLAPFDKNSTCAKAAIQSFSRSSPFSRLIDFLLSPVLRQNFNLVSNGLGLVGDYLTKEQIEQDELINCVVPLMSFLSHEDQTIRQKALQICRQLGIVLQDSEDNLSIALASLLKVISQELGVHDLDCVLVLE